MRWTGTWSGALCALVLTLVLSSCESTLSGSFGDGGALDQRAAEASPGGDSMAPDGSRPDPDGTPNPDAALADLGPSDATAADAGVPDAPEPDISPPKPDVSAPKPDVTIDSSPVQDGLPGGPSSTRHTARPLGSTAANRGYYEYLPPGYGDGAKRPLLVFFHGIGENGDGTTELAKVLKAGPPKLIDNDSWLGSYSFIVLSPQHPGSGCFGANEIRTFLTYAVKSYDVDLQRVYLTGLSCGGIGLWNYLGSYKNELAAAAVPIAGNGTSAWNKAGCDLGLVPIWAFHGDADGKVNVSGTNTPVDNLLTCPAPPRGEVKKTIYPGVGHDSWTRTYAWPGLPKSAGHDIYAWMLSKSNPAAKVPAP